MADAVTYLSCILNDGKFAIGQGLVAGKKLKPHSFIAGDAYNFTPLDTDQVVQGNVVYTGDTTLIEGSILSKDTFQFALTFPESAGDFTIGNIILYIETDDGQVLPFIHVVSKVPRPKQGIKGTGIGNRYIFNFIERIVNAGDALEMTITPSQFASLATFKSENDLPLPTQALFQQFVVSNPVFSLNSFIGIRRAIDNTYWGLPLYFRVGEPFFGIIDGGRAAEIREQPYQGRYFWGGTLSMPDSTLNRSFGGGRLTDTPAYSVGGLPLPSNPGYPKIT